MKVKVLLVMMMLIIPIITGNAKENPISFNYNNDPQTIVKYNLNKFVEYTIVESEYIRYLVSIEMLNEEYKKEYKQIRMKNLQIKILIFTTCFFSVCFIGVITGVVTYAVMKSNGF